jgi:head-tail adaptor
MRSGSRTEPVTIEQKVTGTRSGPHNERVDTWEELRTCFARVESKGGREHFENGKRYNETVYLFTFDFYDVSDVTDQMRLVFNGGYYSIRKIARDFAERRSATFEATTSDEDAT